MEQRKSLSIAFAFVIVASLISPCLAIQLDDSFASGGKFITTFGDTGDPNTSGTRVFVQPSGRIIVIGRHQQLGGDGSTGGIAIAGLTSAGVLDSNFGTGGKILIWSFSGNAFLNDAVMLEDGSFLLFYQFLQTPNTHIPILVKYTANGQPDSTFSSDVRLSGLFPTQSMKLALGPSGKIYALVSQGTNNALLRLNSNGSRDGTFATEGVRPLELRRISAQRRFVAGLHALPKNKILVTGFYEFSDTFEFYGFAARFDSDTNVDRTFGLQGVARIAIPGGSASFSRSLVQPDGKVLMGGSFTFLGSNALLVRLTGRGRLDATFGTGGISMSSIENVNGINGMTLAPDGRIVAAGTSSQKTFPTVQHFFIARFSSSGVRESFLFMDFIAGRHAGGFDVALQNDGKYVGCGLTNAATGSLSQMAVGRFLP